MKGIFFTLLCVAALSANVTAQDAWKNYSRTAELEINYRYVECHDVQNGIHRSIVVLQFVNLTGNHVSVSFNKQTWYNDKCLGCENTLENQNSLRLSPHETREGSCEDKKSKTLYIFDKMLDVKASKLQKFELANIHITTVQ